MQRRAWVAPILAAGSAVWCVVVGFMIWFTPVRYSGITGGPGQPGRQVVSHLAFSEISPFGALPLILPVVIAILATWAAWRGVRTGLGGLALLFAVVTFVSGFSIGGAYVPAAGVLSVAAVLSAVLGSGRSGLEVQRGEHDEQRTGGA